MLLSYYVKNFLIAEIKLTVTFKDDLTITHFVAIIYQIK